MAYDAPKPEQFADADGYIDWSDYDYAWSLWRDSVPNLGESWCGEVDDEPTLIEPENTLQDLLAALLA